MKKFTKRLFGFFKLPISEKILFLEAVVWLFTAKGILLLFPFKHCLKLISCKNCQQTENQELLKSIKRAIHRANYLKIWKNVCLVQSFAARWMLNRRGIQSTLKIGVAHDEGKNLKAHAWLSSGEIELVSEIEEFQGIFYFN